MNILQTFCVSKMNFAKMNVSKMFMSNYDLQKKHYLVRLHLMTNVVKLNTHLGVFLIIMISIMEKYIRYKIL
jgi:hypothetical protein